LLDLAGTRDYPERQRSLRAVLDSTVDLLGADGRAVLLHLALVDGPFTLDVLAAVAERLGCEGYEVLTDLVEAGVLDRLGDDRFQIPPPVRQHTIGGADSERLSTASTLVLAVVTDLAERADGHWYGPDANVHRARLARDEPTIDAALATALKRGDWRSAARLAISLAPFWLQQSRLTTALDVLDALDAAELDPEDDARIALLRGSFASYINRPDTADVLTDAIARFERAGLLPDRLLVNAWCCLGAFHANRHAEDDIRRSAAAAADAAAASGDPTLVALARDFAGYAATYLGDTETAIDLTMEAIDDARRQGDLHALVLLLATATEGLLQVGRLDEADALSSEAFEIARTVDLGIALTWVLLVVGATQIELGRPAAARGSLLEHLRYTRERYPDPLSVGDSLSHLAAVHALSGDDEAAARTWGASVAMHADNGADPDRRRPDTLRRHWAAARDRLGADRFDGLLRAGATNADGVIDGLLADDAR
jgi:predicted ATPase